jgi:tetratricopeptide (TPR) repeat protein
VIARNSSFAYRGRAADAKQIGRELGVAYLIQGSVQRREPRLRVSAQLVDARSGHHLWAERFDRELSDLFALQDEIVDAVLVRIQPEIVRVERERVRRSDPACLGAWDCVVLGRWHADQLDRESNLRARELAERALALDPGCIEAVRLLQNLEILANVNQWPGFPDPAPARHAELAQRAIDLCGESWQGCLSLGAAQSMLGDFDSGLSALERAVELNPSSSDALVMLANTLARADRAAEGLPLLETSVRLDPTPWGFRAFNFAFVLLYAGRPAEAIPWAERALRANPNHGSTHRFLAASLAEAGRLDEARAAVAEMLRRFPDFRISILEQIAPAQPKVLPRLAAALRKAGAPE